MLLVGLAARMFTQRWRHLSAAAFVVVAACIVGAVAAEWAFGKAVEKTIGAPPLRLPHPMARLVDMGPGTEFLKQHCPEAGYVACQFRDHFPTAWDDFLFSADPTRALSGWPMRRASGAWRANSCASSWMCCATTRWA